MSYYNDILQQIEMSAFWTSSCVLHQKIRKKHNFLHNLLDPFQSQKGSPKRA